VEFPNAVPLREMIPALLAHVGGVDHLCAVRDKVKPEYREIDLALSIKFSEEQDQQPITEPRITLRFIRATHTMAIKTINQLAKYNQLG
jgi:hypothetical protein